ncbi:MAG: DUF2244 domain-containing protein [Gammaproteobacteria bacterium]
MVSDEPIVTRIVIRRNQSLGRAGLIRALVLGGVPAAAFTALAIMEGWWPIVGYCGGAFLVLAAALYGVMLGARDREVVTISARRVIVECGRSHPQMRIEFDRYWTRIERREGRRPALVLRSHGVALEIAAALAEPQREALARRLAELIGPAAANETTAAALPTSA